MLIQYAPTKSEPPAWSPRWGLNSTSRSTVYPVRDANNINILQDGEFESVQRDARILVAWV